MLKNNFEKLIKHFLVENQKFTEKEIYGGLTKQDQIEIREDIKKQIKELKKE